MFGKEFFIRRYEQLGWTYREFEPKQSIRINTMNTKKKDFVKLHVTIGTFSQMVVCAISTIGKKREPTQFETMIKMVCSVFKIKEWLGDAGYLSRKACNLVTKHLTSPVSL